jgi:hypothetical protein
MVLGIEMTDERWWDLILAGFTFASTILAVLIGASIALRHDRRKRVLSRSAQACEAIAGNLADAARSANRLVFAADWAGDQRGSGFSLEELEEKLDEGIEGMFSMGFESELVADPATRDLLSDVMAPLMSLSSQLNIERHRNPDDEISALAAMATPARVVRDWYHDLQLALMSAAREESYQLPADPLKVSQAVRT